MSGSDSVSSSFGGSSSVSDDACSMLRLPTEVANFDDDLMGEIHIGLELKVGLHISGFTSSPGLYKGERLIGGVKRDGHRLKACLERGYSFVASVTRVDNGIVMVLIKPE